MQISDHGTTYTCTATRFEHVSRHESNHRFTAEGLGKGVIFAGVQKNRYLGSIELNLRYRCRAN